MLNIVSITKKNASEIAEFINSAGTSLQNFRYYEHRSFDIVENHIATILLKIKDEFVAYGHLDKEKENVWLGIAVSEKYRGLKIGNLIMDVLLLEAHFNNVNKIKLSVDMNNSSAISLYKKKGFILVEDKGKIIFMEKNI